MRYVFNVHLNVHFFCFSVIFGTAAQLSNCFGTVSNLYDFEWYYVWPTKKLSMHRNIVASTTIIQCTRIILSPSMHFVGLRDNLYWPRSQFTLMVAHSYVISYFLPFPSSSSCSSSSWSSSSSVSLCIATSEREFIFLVSTDLSSGRIHFAAKVHLNRPRSTNAKYINSLNCKWSAEVILCRSCYTLDKSTMFFDGFSWVR